jgi:hypothetical protein
MSDENKKPRVKRSGGGPARISTGVVGGKYSAPQAKGGVHPPSPDGCECQCGSLAGGGWGGGGKTKAS